MRRVLKGVLLVGTGLLAIGCSSAAPASAPGGSPAGAAGHSAPASAQPAGGGSATAPTAEALIRPPFRKNVHIDMTSWLPASGGERPAVTAAKNFLIAFLYADYTGGRDHRWTRYVNSPVPKLGLTSTLAQPDVRTESFIGTIRFWHMSVQAAPGLKGAVEVTECGDGSRALNTGLKSGKVLPRRLQTPADQNFYSNSDILAKDDSGRWRVISIPPEVVYPRAPQCKP